MPASPPHTRQTASVSAQQVNSHTALRFSRRQYLCSYYGSVSHKQVESRAVSQGPMRPEAPSTREALPPLTRGARQPVVAPQQHGQHVGDLQAQLARGHEHQRVGALAARHARLQALQVGHDGRQVCQRLARPRRRADQRVPARLPPSTQTQSPLTPLKTPQGCTSTVPEPVGALTSASLPACRQIDRLGYSRPYTLIPGGSVLPKLVGALTSASLPACRPARRLFLKDPEP